MSKLPYIARGDPAIGTVPALADNAEWTSHHHDNHAGRYTRSDKGITAESERFEPAGTFTGTKWIVTLTKTTRAPGPQDKVELIMNSQGPAVQDRHRDLAELNRPVRAAAPRGRARAACAPGGGATPAGPISDGGDRRGGAMLNQMLGYSPARWGQCSEQGGRGRQPKRRSGQRLCRHALRSIEHASANAWQHPLPSF